MYFATGATHAPHHAPKEWIAKYKGKFDGGWDKLREETFARQKEMGVIPADTKLTPRPKEIPAWDDMSADQKRLFERQMETFAGFAEHTDHEVGRLVAQLEAHRRARQHALLLHRRRQRRERRGRPGGHLQRDDGAERHRRQRSTR